MSQTALLERETRSTATADETPEAIAHKKRSAEIYTKLRSNDVSDEELIREIGENHPAASAETYAPATPRMSAGSMTAVREVPVREATRPRELFTDVEYKDHRLVRTEEPSAAVTEVPVATPSAPAAPAAPAVKPAAEAEEDNEDLRPTRRTMDMIHRSEVYRPEVNTEAHVGFFASLSSKVKLVLALVAVAVVAAIALVCINTGIINSLNAEIDSRRMELQGLSDYSESLNEQIREVTSDEFVDSYAENVLHMTRS